MDPSYLFYIFAGRIPLFLLLLGGIGFAFMRWSRHPRVSFLTILGLFFYLLESIFFTFIVFLLPNLFPTGRFVASDSLYMVLFLLDDIAYTAVIIVLVSAVFTQRKPEQATTI